MSDLPCKRTAGRWPGGQGDQAPDKMQRLLERAAWDAGEAMAAVRAFVAGRPMAAVRAFVAGRPMTTSRGTAGGMRAWPGEHPD